MGACRQASWHTLKEGCASGRGSKPNEMFYQITSMACNCVDLFVQELPEQWNNVKKQSVLMKQAVAPLQATEVGIIRRKLATFDVSTLVTSGILVCRYGCIK